MKTPQQWSMSDEQAADLVNELSFVAANLINEYASTFELKSEYDSIEGLAKAVQKEIVQKGCKILYRMPI